MPTNPWFSPAYNPSTCTWNCSDLVALSVVTRGGSPVGLRPADDSRPDPGLAPTWRASSWPSPGPLYPLGWPICTYHHPTPRTLHLHKLISRPGPTIGRPTLSLGDRPTQWLSPFHFHHLIDRRNTVNYICIHYRLCLFPIPVRILPFGLVFVR